MHRDQRPTRVIRTWLVSVAVLALVAAPALAAPVVIDDTFIAGGDGVQWDFNNAESAYDQCVIQDAPALEIDGGFPSSDVFDGGASFQVGNKAFYDSNGNGNKEGKSLRAGPESMGPLDVALFHKTFQDMAVLRSLLRLKNTTNRAVTRLVYFDSAFGTDFATRATESGNLAWTKGDRWAMFADYGEPTRPWATFAFYGPGDPRVTLRTIIHRPWESDVGTGEDCVTVDYRVRVPANSTRYLAVLTLLIPDDKTRNQALNEAKKFDGPQGPFFVGLTDGIKDKVVNWDL